MSATKPKKILIAPLDWGLGHATRCIPLIKELLKANCQVLIASEGSQQALLKEEFPAAVHLPLRGYRMQYAKNGKRFGLKMLAQLPKMRNAIRREHHWLKRIVASHQPDGIISDNRFGLYHPKIPSIIMTHQLRIIAPFKGKPEDILQRINYRYLNRFDGAWIVDFEDPRNNLAGKLSHPELLPGLPIKYLGALSRFSNKKTAPMKYDLLVLLSGPEPQRSKLEALLRKQLLQTTLKTLLVCGKPDHPHEMRDGSNIESVSHLPAAELETALLQSKLVLSRPGYTTIMDLAALQKKVIFIPTPGQTEQEYLAKTLEQKGCFPAFPQQEFALDKALETASSFPFHKLPLPEMNEYKKVVSEFIKRL